MGATVTAEAPVVVQVATAEVLRVGTSAVTAEHWEAVEAAETVEAVAEDWVAVCMVAAAAEVVIEAEH